jgi:hypothetical protein
MNRLQARGLGPAFPLLLAACAVAPIQHRGPTVDHHLIAAEEIRAAGYTDAFRVVESLRPQWLRTRGPTSLSPRETVKVYLDGSLLGGPEQLQHITTSSIASIRFFDGNEATQRWGLDHGQGAIVVSTRRDHPSSSGP